MPEQSTLSADSSRPARRGSEARRARRSERDRQAPPYISRRIPLYDLLGEEGLAALDDHADRILQEIGIEFHGDAECLRLWKEAGADVQGERVRFERGMVRRIIQATTPRQFTQQARNPARSVEIGGDNVVFSPAYGSPFVRDLEGGRRYGSIEDFRNFVKLAYSSPWLHHSGGTICEPVDIPVNKRHLDMVYAHIRWSDKAFMGSVTAPERAEDSIEMCRLLFGAEFVDRNCVILGNINVNSPLVYDVTMTGALRAYAAANQAAVVVPFILGGAMGPVTTAGAIAQAHAEAMVGVALTQLVRPGAPVIYGNFLSSMSLRSGAPTFGMPEPALAYLAVGQLARRLGVPLRCGGSLTASKVADAQAAQESADSLMPALLCGANFILHAAGWLEGGLTMGYEKFVIDADHLGMMHVFTQGLTLDDNAFALDAFREVGPGKHFLGCAHTMANYQTAFYDPEVADNDSFEQWRDAGEKDTQARAHARWKKMLSEYVPPPIDPAVDEALQDFIARKKEAIADAWH
ncbi:trimethylamine methyltransferase family protein [Rhodospirillaceae bacterium SYSU D60014]|uniref:trimethylamine methyltransferase family protein n=1 Tax=Virgifigura deserti TaxID=2268457 RepID=UPI000E6604B5